MASVVLFLLPPLLALLPELRAQEVLVPEFTPTEFTDIEVASSVYTRTLDRLASLGVPCVDAAGLRLVVGNEADMCGDEPTCPGSLWPSFPKARVAIVGGVARGDGTIVMRVDFYTPSTFVPVETVEQVMMESGYETMAQGIADATVRILENIRAAETEAAAAVPETRPRGRKVLEAGKGRNLEVETLGAEPRPGKPDARAQSAEKKPKAEKPKAEKPKAEKPGEKTPREKASREDKSEPVAASRPPETRPTEQKPSSSPASSTSTRPNVVVSSVSPPRRKGEPVRKPEPGASATGTSWWRPWARYRAWMAAATPTTWNPRRAASAGPCGSPGLCTTATGPPRRNGSPGSPSTISWTAASAPRHGSAIRGAT
jgi:hypothetical protein